MEGDKDSWPKWVPERGLLRFKRAGCGVVQRRSDLLYYHATIIQALVRGRIVRQAQKKRPKSAMKGKRPPNTQQWWEDAGRRALNNLARVPQGASARPPTAQEFFARLDACNHTEDHAMAVDARGGVGVTACAGCGADHAHKRCETCRQVVYCNIWCATADAERHQIVCGKKVSELTCQDINMNAGAVRSWATYVPESANSGTAAAAPLRRTVVATGWDAATMISMPGAASKAFAAATAKEKAKAVKKQDSRLRIAEWIEENGLRL